MDVGPTGDLGYLATECPLSLDIQAEMESLQSFYNNESKKLTQLTAPSRQPGDISSFCNRTDAVDLCTFTSVSSDESKLLEEFMTFATDFGSSKERPTLTELTVCDNLSRQGERHSDPLQSSCTVTSLSSLPGQYGAGGQYNGQHQHRDKYPAKRRLHSTPFATSPSKPVKASKPTRSMSAGETGMENRDMRDLGGNSGGGMYQGSGSLLRQRLEGTHCSTKYNTALTSSETLCKDCGAPYTKWTAKCLMQVCRKSDEVLCPLCGQELTAKCLLKVCKSDSRPGSV